MNKYVIQISFLDGSTEKIVGTGKPMSIDGQIMIVTPSGKEVVRERSAIKGFHIAPYEES